MKLNAALGESYGDWVMGSDEQIRPHIHQANIACGFHAGDPLTLQHTLALAAKHQVAVGAHPAYPDLAGFGRRSMRLSHAEIVANLHYQVAALQGMAAVHALELNHIKPHGALYNDMMSTSTVRTAIFDAVASYPGELPLVVQGIVDPGPLLDEAQQHGITLQFEAFADRRYRDAVSDLSHWPEFDFAVINDDLDTAAAELSAIVESREGHAASSTDAAELQARIRAILD